MKEIIIGLIVGLVVFTTFPSLARGVTHQETIFDRLEAM